MRPNSCAEMFRLSEFNQFCQNQNEDNTTQRSRKQVSEPFMIKKRPHIC